MNGKAMTAETIANAEGDIFLPEGAIDFAS